MAHKLDILVTHYKEQSDIVIRFLASLKKQSFKDLKVTIVDDGLDCPEIDLNSFDFGFPVEHLKFEHKTVSKARNNAMENTSAEYLMFCDCDDMFYDGNPYGLAFAMWRIEQNKIDTYMSCHASECWRNSLKSNVPLSSLYSTGNDDELTIVKNNKINNSTVHSKIYRRSFAEKFGLRFDDELWMNEDGVFNSTAWCICEYSHGKSFVDNECFYVWKYNESSATRNNKMYPILGYDQFLKSTERKYEKLEAFAADSVENYSKFEIDVCSLVFQTYFWLYLYSDKFIGMSDFEKRLDDDLEEFKKFLAKYGKYVNEKTFETNDMKQYMESFMKQISKEKTENKDDFKTWLERFKFKAQNND